MIHIADVVKGNRRKKWKGITVDSVTVKSNTARKSTKKPKLGVWVLVSLVLSFMSFATSLLMINRLANQEKALSVMLEAISLQNQTTLSQNQINEELRSKIEELDKKPQSVINKSTTIVNKRVVVRRQKTREKNTTGWQHLPERRGSMIR